MTLLVSTIMLLVSTKTLVDCTIILYVSTTPTWLAAPISVEGTLRSDPIDVVPSMLYTYK